MKKWEFILLSSGAACFIFSAIGGTVAYQNYAKYSTSENANELANTQKKTERAYSMQIGLGITSLVLLAGGATFHFLGKQKAKRYSSLSLSESLRYEVSPRYTGIEYSMKF